MNEIFFAETPSWNFLGPKAQGLKFIFPFSTCGNCVIQSLKSNKTLRNGQYDLVEGFYSPSLSFCLYGCEFCKQTQKNARTDGRRDEKVAILGKYHLARKALKEESRNLSKYESPSVINFKSINAPFIPDICLELDSIFVSMTV